MKTISVFWALLAGALTVAAQIIVFYIRFGRWNTVSPLEDYLFFFLAGTLGGWILIFFLNRQTSTTGRWIAFTSFLVASPIALFLMIGAGVFGWPGVFFLPQIPWFLLTWIGSSLGRLLLKE